MLEVPDEGEDVGAQDVGKQKDFFTSSSMVDREKVDLSGRQVRLGVCNPMSNIPWSRHPWG